MKVETANSSADSKPACSRKRLFCGLAATLLFFIAGDLAFRLVGKLFLYSPWAASGDVTTAEDIFWIDGRKPDVVFLGDSRFGEGIKPETVEKAMAERGERLSAVNIWLAAAGPEEYRAIVRNLLAHHQPRLILCAINENALSKEPAVENQPGGSDIQQRLQAFEDKWDWHIHTLFAAKHWGALIEQAFYNMVSDLGRVLLLGDERSDANLGKSKGYFKNRGRQRSANLALREAVDARVYRNIQVTRDAALKYNALLSAIRENDLRLVMILAPVAPELAEKLPPERYHALIRFLEESAAAAGIPFINYYQIPDLPTDAFFDHHHLNDKGAEMFSRKITGEVVAPALRDWKTFKSAAMANQERNDQRSASGT